MTGQELLNMTLRINAAFSLFSGLDFILFDRVIVSLLIGGQSESILPTGVMLVGFAVFVFAVSLMKNVNKYLVGAIIVMDTLWVIGSALIVTFGSASLTGLGQVLIVVIGLIIAIFAYLQARGLRQHLAV